MSFRHTLWNRWIGYGVPHFRALNSAIYEFRKTGQEERK